MSNIYKLTICLLFTSFITKAQSKIDLWLSKADQTALLQKQEIPAAIIKASSTDTITINSEIQYQTIDGFGYTLTGGSALLIHNLPKADRQKLLQELFGHGPNSINISYLRISIGASDLDPTVFTYNDLPKNQTDNTLSKFSLRPDFVHLIPLLHEIKKVNPKLKIMATPWTAPIWMKNNNSSIGGSLMPKHEKIYAQYLIKYIQKMKAIGLEIDAITIQNEPQNDKNNPSMLMTATEQASFIKNHLGPAFKKAKVNTKIIIFDHNCDTPQYPITILADPATAKYIDGSAFHLYGGEATAMGKVHDLFPDKNIYFTEQWTGAKGQFEGDLLWHTKNVVIAGLRNWSKTILEWNLANNANYEPHTPGGCTECKGALTIQNNTINRNASYYIIAQASKYIKPSALRIQSNSPTNLPNVAFKNTDGTVSILVLNDHENEISFYLKYNQLFKDIVIPAKSVITLILK